MYVSNNSETSAALANACALNVILVLVLTDFKLHWGRLTFWKRAAKWLFWFLLMRKMSQLLCTLYLKVRLCSWMVTVLAWTVEWTGFECWFDHLWRMYVISWKNMARYSLFVLKVPSNTNQPLCLKNWTPIFRYNLTKTGHWPVTYKRTACCCDWKICMYP